MVRQICRLSVLAVGCVAVALAQQSKVPRLGADAPTLNYKEVPNWPTRLLNAAGTPAPWNFIQVSGVAVDSRGHILVLHRGAHALLDFESNGTLVHPWTSITFSEGKVAGIAKPDQVPGKSHYSAVYGVAGCDSCGAHSVRMDPEHNIWVIDAPGQVIYKLDPTGKILMQSARREWSERDTTPLTCPPMSASLPMAISTSPTDTPARVS